MLTDEARIKVRAGNGGNGVVAFDKIKMSLGPTGGRGGNGGNIYFEGVSDIFALRRYRHQKKYLGRRGQDGKGNKSDGLSGEDLILTVPIGTTIHNLTTNKNLEIVEVGQRILIAKGGVGGRGNFYFRSSTNTTPREHEEGRSGEEVELYLELKLIAEIGLIGLPSAGKSSLLNELTAANVKVGAYHFTTLEPNLGVMDNIILADIPGLIEGASKGRGLGTKFLRHIQRTKILAHCISLESADLKHDYQIIRKELENYSQILAQKKEIIILTKSDLVSSEDIKKKMANFPIEKEILIASIHDLSSIIQLQSKFKELLH